MEVKYVRQRKQRPTQRISIALKQISILQVETECQVRNKFPKERGEDEIRWIRIKFWVSVAFTYRKSERTKEHEFRKIPKGDAFSWLSLRLIHSVCVRGMLSMHKHSSMHCRQQYTKGRFGCTHGMWKEEGKAAPRRGGKVPRAGEEPEVNQTYLGNTSFLLLLLLFCLNLGLHVCLTQNFDKSVLKKGTDLSPTWVTQVSSQFAHLNSFIFLTNMY